MAQISINNLTFGYEGSFDYVFENVSFSIDTNWKLGFIGRNGKGKTTFLNLLLGKYQYTGSISASTKFDYFPYEIAEYQKQRPVAEFIEDLKPGCEIWRVICELEELSESSEILYRPYCTLSPGERTKRLLAVLFSQENEFLLIDEPTNHLDQNAREGVKVYLDVSLKRFTTFFPACGSSNSAIELTCEELEKYSSNCQGWVDLCKGWQQEEG